MGKHFLSEQAVKRARGCRLTREELVDPHGKVLLQLRQRSFTSKTDVTGEGEGEMPKEYLKLRRFPTGEKL